MHKVAEGEIFGLARPTVIFSRIDELEIPELNDAETDPPENHQENGATLPVNTWLSPPYSPPEENSVESAATPPSPCVEAGDAALKAREGGLPDVQLLGSDYMLYGVYQDWVHRNPGYHLDEGKAEDSK